MKELKTKLVTIRVTPSVKNFIKINKINQTKLFNNALKKVKQGETIR